MLEKIGINREEVAARIFDTAAKGPVFARTLSYKSAVLAVCALGVGSSHALNNLAVSMAHGLTTTDRTLANDLSSRLVQQGVASLRGRT